MSAEVDTESDLTDPSQEEMTSGQSSAVAARSRILDTADAVSPIFGTREYGLPFT